MRKVITVLTMLVLMSGALQGQTRGELAQKLERQLEKESDAVARKKLIVDILDLQDDNAGRQKWGERLYEASKAAKDTAGVLDALCLTANAVSGNDSLLLLLQRRAELLPINADQKEAVTFIKLKRISEAAKQLNGIERMQELHVRLQKYAKNPKNDLYRKIEVLYTVCCFLQGYTRSGLISDKLEELRRLALELPEGKNALRNAIYLRTAVDNTYAMNSRQALEDNRELLKLIEEIEEHNQRAGRKHVNYDRQIYMAYGRMLANYQHLSAKEVEEIKAKIDEIRMRNAVVDEDYKSRQAIPAYYHLARGEYAAAIPHLRAALANASNGRSKLLLSSMFVDAANALGDRNLKAEAYDHYVPELKALTAYTTQERALGKRVLIDMEYLEDASESLRQPTTEATTVSATTAVLWEAVVICLLLVAIIAVVLSLWHNNRAGKQTKRSLEALKAENAKLKEDREKLEKEREEAMKTEKQRQHSISTIIHDLSEPVEAILGYTQLVVDSIEGSRQKYYDRFVDVITLNSQLLKTLSNDILDVAELESTNVALKIKNTGMKSVCEISGRSVEKRANPEVEFAIEPLSAEDEEAVFDTDPVRIEQVLINLLLNAFKYTESGRVTLRYGIDREREKAMFMVEDTGPGVPEGKEEAIFRRFEKVDHQNPGRGLGLHICSLIAKILGGCVYVDRSYKKGARFVFEQPLDVLKKGE